MASYSSSASRSLSRASRSTWSSDVDRRPRAGAPSCVTTRRTSPPWTCSSFRPSASTGSMRSSSFGWSRRDLVWINVTTHTTTDWIARQITEAFPWAEAPRYLIRDRDCVYGAAFTHRLRTMGIRDKPIAPGSPWQNGFAERLIGSIRRECVDHLVVLGEAHLRRILTKYAIYYNELRTHRSLNKDAPIYRAIQHVGRIVSAPVLGGLHPTSRSPSRSGSGTRHGLSRATTRS